LEHHTQNHHAERDEYVPITLRVMLGTIIFETYTLLLAVDLPFQVVSVDFADISHSFLWKKLSERVLRLIMFRIMPLSLFPPVLASTK